MKCNLPVILVLLGAGGYIAGAILMGVQEKAMPGIVGVGIGVLMVVVGAILEILEVNLD